MAKDNSRQIPLDKAASFDQVVDAINSLSPIQLKRLEKFARFRVIGLGRKALGRDWEDLFHDAIEAFCEENRRRWDKERFDIVRGLAEAMRSISDSWKRSFDEREPRLESELATTSLDVSESKVSGNVQGIQKKIEDDEKQLKDKMLIEKIENLLAKRERAALIFLGMKDGMSGTEIRDDMKLSQTEYETEMRWIRRTARATFKEHDNVKRKK